MSRTILIPYVTVVLIIGTVLSIDTWRTHKIGAKREGKWEDFTMFLYLIFALLTLGLGAVWIELLEERLRQRYWEPCPIIGKPCEFYVNGECKWKNYGYGCYKKHVEPELEEWDIIFFFGLAILSAIFLAVLSLIIN